MGKTNRTGSIKVGIVGVGRGSAFARDCTPQTEMDLVAVCDGGWEERLRALGDELNVATYADYDRFLEHEMDAVILANYFHQHAPLAIKALGAGKHVMSETAACATLAEGVALVRAVERSQKVYMFAENYPYSIFVQEMRRLYQAGEIGDFRYGEGEYVHPTSARYANELAPGMNHWRNWIPSTYYCTHALAPIMFITDTWPVKVNGFVVPYDGKDLERRRTVRRQDTASMVVLRMDNGAVVKLLQGNLRGHAVFYRLHGNRGLMENLRHGDTSHLRLHKEPWDVPSGETLERTYAPELPAEFAAAVGSGHGGGDFFMTYQFGEAIRSGTQPYLDVHRGVAMSIVGILAYRSALADSAALDVPDFRDEGARREYEDDHWSPDPERCGPGQPRSSITGEIKPDLEAIEFARKVWREIGYTGS